MQTKSKSLLTGTLRLIVAKFQLIVKSEFFLFPICLRSVASVTTLFNNHQRQRNALFRLVRHPELAVKGGVHQRVNPKIP